MSSSSSPVREFLSFKRTFTLLILLVVIPSAGLSGFGIVAIVNERAAVEKRLELAWQGRLESLSEAMGAALSASQLTPTADGLDMVAPARGGESLALEGTGFVVAGGAVRTTDPELARALQRLEDELATLPSQRAVFTLSEPQGTRVLATLRTGNRLQGLQLSLDGLGALAQRLADPDPQEAAPATYEIRPVQRPVQQTLVDRLVSEVAQAREAVTGPGTPQPLAERALPPPLQDVKLVVVASGEDPVALTATRNRAVYGTLLGLFYVTLVVGVVITGRTLYREAQLSRLKTDFVSLVSHELRTPLTSIRMFIETLALGRVKDEAQTREVLGLLLQETERLSALIERVLDWGRIESGRKTYRFELLEVDEVLALTVAAFRAQRLDGSYTLDVQAQDGLPAVQVDREAISGALLNLLHNAYKYSEGDKHITVRAHRDRKGVAIEVHDTGVGISLRDRRKIFDRFYRVDNLLTRKSEGSGLGLSIARRIVEAHGGQISVASHQGRGSTFTIHLPAASTDRRPSAKEATS